MKLWDKGIQTEEVIERYTVGNDLDFDNLLAPYDIQGNIAHVKMLQEVGLLTKDELDKLLPELDKLLSEFSKEGFSIPQGFEDVHSYSEYRLVEALGDIGKKVHTARSRNDQVLVDLKLYFRDVLANIISDVQEIALSLCDLADTHKEKFLPGYTHLQMAMPSSFGLWFSAYAEALSEDLYMLKAAHSHSNLNPLGSAAGYGSSFPIDRESTTQTLGFDNMHVNSVNAQMNRGKSEFFVASAMASVAMTLNKFASDICLFNSQHFNFIKLPKEVTTGSSIMPHKTNPDVFELMRGRTTRIMNTAPEVMRLCSNLPSGYHRDFQLLKEIIFPQITSLQDSLHILKFTLTKLEPVELNPLADQYQLLYTVDAINDLIKDGVPFRDAYKQVGEQALNGSFKTDKTTTHTHIGSKDNLQLDRIKQKIKG